MKLATFDAGEGAEIGAVLEGQRIVSISRAAPGLATDMIDLIGKWDQVHGEVERIASAGEGAMDLGAMDLGARNLGAVHLLAPVRRPGKIFAIGLNYADHIEESGMDAPKEQVWFTKAVTSINGPFDTTEIPKVSQLVDYEVELVAIIGKGGKHIAAADAPSHVFGYCVGNDVTERAWQFRTPQWALGKSFDTHAPIGPWITTSDELGNPHNLGIRCLVNGETRQASNTEHLIFNIWDQVEQLSQAMTLEPGDVIFTGTPAGVGAMMDPAQFLKAGDEVRCEIDRLGAIETRFEPES